MKRPPAEVVLGSFSLVMLSVTLAFCLHASSRGRLPLFVELEPALPETVEPVEVGRARELWESGWLFVDARERVAYEAGRIADAFSLPAGTEVGPEALGRLKRAPGVVVYCDGPTCGASNKVAAHLVELGVSPIVVITKGYPAWAARGYPTERGPR